MKITKYPQSCLLIEKNGQKIVIDPGSFFSAKYGVEDLDVMAVLYTHQHADHFDASLAEQLGKRGIALYGNAAVAALIGADAITIVSGQAFELAGFAIMPHDLPHCVMVDGSDGPRNTGYIIDGHFFHPGDGFKAEGLSIDHVALSIAGPSISFYHAARLADSLGAKKVIPMHYDAFLADPVDFARRYGGAEVIVLENGDSVELG